VIGAIGNKAGDIVANRSRYGTPNPRTIVRTPVGGVDMSTKTLSRTGASLKGAGVVAGFGGLAVTGYQLYNGQISGTEAAVDAAFGAIGFTGWGAPISIAYFGGKFLYEYSTGNTLFDKP